MGQILAVLTGWRGYAAAAVAAAFVAGFLVHKIDSASLNALKAADNAAALHAVERVSAARLKADAVAETAAVAAAREEGKLEAERFRIPERIIVHVKDRSACITFGLVRVLNGAALGSGPGSGPVAAGQPDDACAPVSWRSFAADIADDYVSARENAGQLTALEKSVRDIAEAQNAGN